MRLTPEQQAIADANYERIIGSVEQVIESVDHEDCDAHVALLLLGLAQKRNSPNCHESVFVKSAIRAGLEFKAQLNTDAG